MRIYKSHWLKTNVAQNMRLNAIKQGFYNGIPTLDNIKLINNCNAKHVYSGTTLVFTRDQGMHSCGWWKNPDYERCWHLSLSFFDPITLEDAPQDKKQVKEWLEVFFGDDCKYVWAESPFSKVGKAKDVWHYRLFCDANWQPIIPRGEVYSNELTEIKWLSFSELNFEKEKV